MFADALAPCDDELLASVVVPVRGDPRVLRLIRSLADQSVPPAVYEVIVVENGTSELSGVIADLTGRIDVLLRYVHLAQANAAAARNAGLRAARGRFLLLTDADCVAAPDWIQQLTHRLADGLSQEFPVVAVGGPITKYQPRSPTQRHGITIVDGQRALNFLPAMPLPYVVSANAGFVTAVVQHVGGFDERFLSGNDVDLCYRLQLAGYAVALAPLAVISHEDRRSVAAHFTRFRRYAIYQVGLFAKYRQHSGRRAVLNPYPLQRFWRAVLTLPTALIDAASGQRGPLARAGLQIVEALGIWCGDVTGSLRYRKLYI